MEVFIGNLPMQATLEELRKFFGGLDLKASFDCRRGRSNEQECYFYLIARTRDETEGQALIEKLNGQPFLDKAILARPLVARQPIEQPPTPDQERRCNSGNPDDSIPLFLEDEDDADAEDKAPSQTLPQIQAQPAPTLTLISGTEDRDRNCAEPVAAAL